VRAAREVEAIAVGELRRRMGDVGGAAAIDALADRVVAGELDPYAAADELVGRL
jgi:LAO/AO transport system kinase